MPERSGQHWTRSEVDLAVADYFDMLRRELSGERYSKTDHRNTLRAQITARSASSIEFKHQNISAVLVRMGLPYIDGYKPRGNFQALLMRSVDAFLRSHEGYFEQLTEGPVLSSSAGAVPAPGHWNKVFIEPPERIDVPEDEDLWRKPHPVKIDFLKRDAENHKLGQAGERWVVALERARLKKAGHDDLANQVEWVSESQGDGLGYDVRSFDPASKDERWIEVKITTFGRFFPFYVSRNEVRCSAAEPERFHLYRIYAFNQAPRVYVLPGPLEQSCRLDPVQYRAAI